MSHPDTEDALPVTIVDRPAVKEASSQLSSWYSYVLLGTEVAFQLLPQDARRHRAIILVQGIAANFVILGKQNQISNNQGARVLAPASIVTESAAAVWCIPQSGQPVTIAVQDERYSEG
jgi:hypothetical protein